MATKANKGGNGKATDGKANALAKKQEEKNDQELLAAYETPDDSDNEDNDDAGKGAGKQNGDKAPANKAFNRKA